MLLDTVKKYSTQQAVGGGWQLGMMSVKTDSFPERLAGAGEGGEGGSQERPPEWGSQERPITHLRINHCCLR